MKALAWLTLACWITITYTAVAGATARSIASGQPLLKGPRIQFKDEYVQDTNFAKNFVFKDVTDIAVNAPLRQVLVLQRSVPFVTVWSTNGTLIHSWTTTKLGYPHSITLQQGTDPLTASVWITDMGGPMSSVTTSYGHCVKEFSYQGKFTKSIGNCGAYTNGSRLNPIEFDKVTDLAWSSNSGHYYITDGDLGGLNNRMLVLDANLKLINVWNSNNKPGPGPIQFNLPHAIKIDDCHRVWVSDALNNRVQVISEKGTFLGELKCFGNALVYGLDFIRTNYTDSVLLTTKNSSNNHAEIISIPVEMDCSKLNNIGTCNIDRRFVLSVENKTQNNSNSMLHSVTVDPLNGDIYLTQLPGNTPPLKFYPAPHPPVGNVNGTCGTDPPKWPLEWNATVLLTPYTHRPLVTAQLIYSAQSKAMYLQTSSSPEGSAEHMEVLTIEDKMYIIERDAAGNTKCLGPTSNKDWSTPAPDWLNGHNCKCHGAKPTAGINTVLWKCPNNEKFIDWFWFEETTQLPWRMFFNANASRIPVLGDYTMSSFSSHGTNTQLLNQVLELCTSKTQSGSNHTIPPPHLNFVTGFSYSNQCTGKAKLQRWPEQFYLTVTMLPVNDFDPMPTSVIYDWTRRSQHTIMYSTNYTTSAYLIRNNTYIVQNTLDNKKITCLSHLTDFGPPNPQWMFTDKCTCMGTITNNFVLSPWPETTIAVCPVADNRVFWTWFSINNYYPVIFFETLSPPKEGTNLAFADYHGFYTDNILVDLQDFKAPKECNAK